MKTNVAENGVTGPGGIYLENTGITSITPQDQYYFGFLGDIHPNRRSRFNTSLITSGAGHFCV